MSLSSRKKPKISQDTAFFTLTNGRLKRGSLDILPSLPLDVLCEIFCFLLPADLLVLARTSKSFRRLLLGALTTFIWRSARRNVSGLPEPPSDMNEVQYASLVFGSACYYKGCDRKARDTVWHLRIRSCVSCRPRHQPVKTNESDDCLAICAMLNCPPDALEQYIPCGPFFSSKGNPIKGFQESHVRVFRDELGALPLSERPVYLDRRRQTTEVQHQFASAGVAWQMIAKNLRITELRNKRAARAEIVREGLVTTGFREEIDYFGWDRIRKHPLISSTQAMSDQALSSVLDQLKEYMLGWRELRMEEQVYATRRQDFVDAWFQFTTATFYGAPSDCPYFPLPPNATIGLSECIDSIIRQPEPVSRESFLEQLQTAFPSACEYILEWQKTVRRELAGLLPDYEAIDDDEAIHAKLNLATSVFHCKAGRNCPSEGRTLAYPEILSHPCFTLVAPRQGPSSKDPRAIASQKACLMMGSSPWSCNSRVQVHPGQYVVNKVLLCCGKDPKSTTTAEMDRQDLGLACLECTLHHRIIAPLSWRRAVYHNFTLHRNSTFNHPARPRVGRNLRLRVDKVTADLRPFTGLQAGNTLGDYSICLLCPPRIPSWHTRFGFGGLVGHIRDKHGVSSPVFGKDYGFDINITPVHNSKAIPEAVTLFFT